MAKVQRKHEILTEPLSQETLRARARDGWEPVAVVWERTLEGEAEELELAPVPYGLQVAPDCHHLEEHDEEVRAMVLMLKLIIDERSFAEVAAELNDRGFRTRQGTEWNQTSVFRMLPRLIEVAPNIYSSREWVAMRPRLQHAV